MSQLLYILVWSFPIKLDHAVAETTRLVRHARSVQARPLANKVGITSAFQLRGKQLEHISELDA